MNAPLPALERLAFLAVGTMPGEAASVAHETLVAAKREVDALREAVAHAAVPPADFGVGALAERERRSPSRIRELIVAGVWGAPGEPGAPFKDEHQRWRVPVAAVLHRDAQRREDGRLRTTCPDDGKPAPVAPPPRMKARSLREQVRRTFESGASGGAGSKVKIAAAAR